MIETNIPKYTLISYSRDKHGEPRGILVAIPKKNKGDFSIGYAQCRKEDMFNKKMGIKIAVGRATSEAIDFDQYSSMKMPHNLRKMLPSFIKRCERYYK